MTDERSLPRATGFYLLGNGYRAYCPASRRFNRSDSWSPFGDGGLNGYAYCLGDPVNAWDPSGHFSWIPRFIGSWFRALLPGRAPGWRPTPVYPELPRSWPAFSAPSGQKNYEGVLIDKLLAKLEPVELTEMRRVSSGVRQRIDSFSERSLKRHEEESWYSWFPDERGNFINVKRTTRAEMAIRSGAGLLGGVALSQASKLMPLSQARTQFARDNVGRWAPLVGMSGRREVFHGVPVRRKRRFRSN